MKADLILWFQTRTGSDSVCRKKVVELPYFPVIGMLFEVETKIGGWAYLPVRQVHYSLRDQSLSVLLKDFQVFECDDRKEVEGWVHPSWQPV